MKIGFSVNGIDLSEASSQISFSMIDSIYSLYSRGSMEIHDESGALKMGMLFIPGSKVELSIETGEGASALRTACPFVVSDPSDPGLENPGSIQGKIDVNLVHEWAHRQTTKSAAFRDRISNIVRQIVATEPFSKVTVNDTGNQDIWYQYGSDARFIDTMLLPNAYSRNADKSPFFAFITSNNEFHFRNLNSLWKEGQVDFTYTYEPLSFSKDNTEENSMVSRILNLKQVTKKPKSYSKNRKLVRIKEADGTVETTQDSILDYPATSTGKYLKVFADTRLDELFLGWDSASQRENQEGLKAFRFREDLLADKLLLLVPLNTALHAGSKIMVKIPYGQSAEDVRTFAERYSGEWLVEMTEQIWNGPDKAAFTKMLVSRKTTRVPGTYPINALLR